MPQRTTSRILLCGGISLVLLSVPLSGLPQFWGSSAISGRISAGDAELLRLSSETAAIGNAVDTLHDARGLQHAYLLTGAPGDLARFDTALQNARRHLQDLTQALGGQAAATQIQPMAAQFLDNLAHGARLREEGHYSDAIAATRIGDGGALLDRLENLASIQVEMLTRRYRDTLSDIRTMSETGDAVARLTSGLAGVSFTIGCVALLIYQRRRLTAESALRKRHDAAVEASALKSRFVAIASHDLRQPLHAISMFVGVLRRRSQDPTVLSVIDNIASAVAVMQRMFAALLDVARLDAGAIEVERRAVALGPLLHSLRNEFAASAAAKGVSLHIQPSDLMVETDPALLETILRNLLSNAIKFTDRGMVGVASHRSGSTVQIIVLDTGMGIAAEDREVIFEQFERSRQAGTAREGLGLGLAIVRRLVDLLGLSLTLESEPGKGTSFAISLPAAEANQAAPPPAPATPPTSDLAGRRILVLDDHAGARRAIMLALETLGAQPLEAESPDSARALLQRMAPDAPDAAVVDHDLGGPETGPDFLDNDARQNGRALPALLITGTTQSATMLKLNARGWPWLIKPVEIEVLRTALLALLDATGRHPPTTPEAAARGDPDPADAGKSLAPTEGQGLRPPGQARWQA